MLVVIGALCALLSLVTGLEVCNPSLVQMSLSGQNVDCVADLVDKKYMVLATSSDGSLANGCSCDIIFGSKNGSHFTVDSEYRDCDGVVVHRRTETYSFYDSYILSDTQYMYFDWCSEHIIRLQRCLVEGATGGFGCSWAFIARKDADERDLPEELAWCKMMTRHQDISRTSYKRLVRYRD